MHQQAITGARARGDLTLYHAPNSRATTTLALLDELGASYQLVPPHPELVDYAARVTARPAFARAAAIDADVLARFAGPKR